MPAFIFTGRPKVLGRTIYALMTLLASRKRLYIMILGLALTDLLVLSDI
jgi:hypothetical protein